MIVVNDKKAKIRALKQEREWNLTLKVIFKISNLIFKISKLMRLQTLLIIRRLVFRAVSGISGSRVPDNRLGYPNPNFGSGTRNDALWEKFRYN